MSTSKAALDQAIFIALQAAATNPATTPEQATAKLQEISRNLSTAIDAYVIAKLGVLASQLINPGAYVGAGGTGPVTITPAGIASYNPTTP